MKRRNFILASSGVAGGALLTAARAAQPCPPPTISVVGGGSASTACPVTPGNSPSSSVLSALAASMPVGTWAKLTPTNDQNAIFGVGPVSGTMLHYCNSMPWNPVARCIEVIGMDHNYPALRHVRYVEASNQVALVADNAGLGPAHGYDHNAVNPYTGDLYHRLYSGFSGAIKVRRKTLGASAFTAIPDLPAADQVAIGACWWSGSFVGAGAQGCFMLFNSGNSTGGSDDGHIAAYDPLVDRWVYSQTGRTPGYGGGSTYHSVIEYSARKNVAVCGGGNVASTRLWRINADGSSLAMPATPGITKVGVQAGVLIDEPVTGNFLLLSAGQLWELDPSGSGTWNALTGSRTPPSSVGVPGPSNPQAVFAASLSQHGVVAFVTQPNQASGTMFLYKHA